MCDSICFNTGVYTCAFRTGNPVAMYNGTRLGTASISEWSCWCTLKLSMQSHEEVGYIWIHKTVNVCKMHAEPIHYYNKSKKYLCLTQKINGVCLVQCVCYV